MKRTLSIAAALLLSASAGSAIAQDRYGPPGNGYYDQRNPYPPQPSYGYPDQPRDGYYDQNYRGMIKWRPGQVVPPQFLNRVVYDWEERGLSRPPSGHQWVRVGFQFLLVRGRDRMIARILNFD